MADHDSATALTFHEVTFDPIEHAPGETWLRWQQIAPALGFRNDRSFRDIYSKHAAEFTDRMTALVKLPTAGGVQEVRIFSLRGAHLLGMFARTARAAEFRRWVLDVLEQHTAPPAGPPLPPPVATATVLATFERVVAERDALRSMLAERVLKEKPRLRKVLYYYGIKELTHTERATLMGWKSTGEWFKDLRELALLGLVDYQPNETFRRIGLANSAKRMAQLAAEGRLKPKTVSPPWRARPGQKGQPAEVLHAGRETRSAKAAARAGVNPHAESSPAANSRSAPDATTREQTS